MSSKPDYNLFLKTYISAYPMKSKELQYKSAQKLWNEVKSDDKRLITTIKDLKNKADGKKVKLLDYWVQKPSLTTTAAITTTAASTTTAATTTTAAITTIAASTTTAAITTWPTSTTTANTTAITTPATSTTTANTTAITTSSPITTPATNTTIDVHQPLRPGQQKTMDEIASVNEKIAGLSILAKNDLLSADQKQTLKKLIREKNQLQKKLKRQETERLRHQKRRRELRSALEELWENPEVEAKLKKFSRHQPSRPRLEEDQPQLLKTIVDIVTIGAAADDRRRSEVLRCCLTLNDLVEQLRTAGFKLSRSATYLRLQPLRPNSTKGKRHVDTVPVKLVRASNDLRKQHQDSHFASATIRHLLDMAVLLGRDCVRPLSRR
jgi:hypothetical protein